MDVLLTSDVVVLGCAAILALLFLRSHLARDYPPPAGALETWITTCGEFAMLPFVKMPVESYRLAQAISIIPLVLGIWILMAGSARLASIVFGGHVPFEQYLSLFGFSFYAFWILAQACVLIYSAILGATVQWALRMEYGRLEKGIVAFLPGVMWTLMLVGGSIESGIVTALVPTQGGTDRHSDVAVAHHAEQCSNPLVPRRACPTAGCESQPWRLLIHGSSGQESTGRGTLQPRPRPHHISRDQGWLATCWRSWRHRS